MVFDQSGNLSTVSRHDYLPFGEELLGGPLNQPGSGGRVTTQGYTADSVRQKFTRKERDNETGLDYFEARYFSSMQGRFTSADEFTGGPHEVFGTILSPNSLLYAEPAEPESFNKYSYCLNNPLRYVDPDGHQTAQADALILPPPSVTSLNATRGVLKELANIVIGAGNVSADFGIPGTKHIEPYRANNMAEGMSMVVTRDISIFGGFLTGKPQAGVMIEEAEAPAVIAGEVGNAQAATEGASTLRPGPNAAGSIPARGSQRNFTTAERETVNEIGRVSGCHTCGTKNPGTKSGNFVLDHQPATGVNVTRSPQRLFPQCLTCSRRQGGDVTAWKAGLPSNR